MLLALLLAAQVATGETLATCRAPNDSAQRSWSLIRHDDALVVVFRSRTLDKPRVELRLPGAKVIIDNGETRVSFKSGNGGRSVDWRITPTASTLDLYVNHGLEVNVEADLDPAVDLMNTEGLLQCEKGPGPIFDGPNLQLNQGKSNFAAGENTGSGPISAGASEWNVAAGAANSVDLFQSTAGRSYAVFVIGWGRELTQDWGPGVVRGRFTWAVEGMPIFAQFSPSSIYGAGFAPVVWRWNFMPQPRWSAFAELSMGGMWSSEPIPEGTSRGNFTAHWGGGLRLRPRGPHALLIAYRFQHFSNGNQLGSNPGVNAHVVLLGWSYRS